MIAPPLNATEEDAQEAKDEADASCDPSCCGDAGNWCKKFIPKWNPGCGRWKDDWYDACKADHCDNILMDLQYAHFKSGSKSGSKGRHAICDDFWECVNVYERYNENAESREKGDDARRDCNQCENSGR